MSDVTRKERNRNFLPALILTILWWSLLGLMIWRVDPGVVADFPVSGSYAPFFLLLFLSLWFTASLLLANTRRGLFVALSGVLWGYLRLWHMGNLLNTLLLISAIGALEVYFSVRLTSK